MNKRILFLIIVLAIFIYIPEVNARQIFVKTPSNETITLEVESSDTIEAVKEKIEEQEKILPKYQKLIYDNRELEEGRTLADYEIENGTTIQLLYTLLSEILINGSNAKVKYKDEFVDKIETTIKTSETISIVPEDNYKIESISIDNGDITENEDGTYTISNITKENAILTIIAMDKDTTTEKITDNDIIWLETNLSEQNIVFGLDNTNNLFEKDSLFWIKVIENTTEEYQHYYNQIDEVVAIENDIIFLIGVKNKDGKDYTTLKETTKLYVEYFDTWENKEIKTFYINQAKDEKIKINIVEKENLLEKNNFVELNLNHFSPYIIYNEKVIEEAPKDEIITKPQEENPNTFDSITKSIFMVVISLIVLIGTIIYFKKKNKVRA